MIREWYTVQGGGKRIFSTTQIPRGLNTEWFVSWCLNGLY